MRRYGHAAGLALGWFLVVGQARAEGPPAARPGDAPRASVDELVPRERPTTRSFYGWKILVTGEVGASLVALSVLLPDKPLDSVVSTGGFVIGMPAYMLGGPIVHWTHGGFAKGLISFGGNATFALVGGLTGQSIRCGNDSDPDCGMKGFFTGVAVGALVAPILDALVLGWENVPLDDYVTTAKGRTSPMGAGRVGWSLSPTWRVGPRGSLELGLVGRF
jgi:hypothetical protein